MLQSNADRIISQENSLRLLSQPRISPLKPIPRRPSRNFTGLYANWKPYILRMHLEVIASARKSNRQKDQITSTLPVTLDQLQFAYRPNRSTDLLHTALSHLDKWNSHVIMLFYAVEGWVIVNVPSKLIIKLEALNPALCNWILDFLPGRPPQVVKVGYKTSTSLILNTRIRAQSPPVLPVHPWLYDHARLQLK
jgi:hypothetical protein